MNNIHGTPNRGGGGSDEWQKRSKEYNEFLIRELRRLQPNKLIESIIEKLHTGELHAPTASEHGSDRRGKHTTPNRWLDMTLNKFSWAAMSRPKPILDTILAVMCWVIWVIVAGVLVYLTLWPIT